MYNLKEITNSIINDDCLNVMKDLPDKCIDHLISDPPYDFETHSGGVFSGNLKFGDVSFEHINIIPIVEEFLRISKGWVIIFTSIENLGLIRLVYKERYIRGGIWDRIVNTPQISGDRPAQAVEGIAILHNKGRKFWNGGGKAGIWRYMVERGNKMHETQKPIKLMEQLIVDFTNQDDLILDPFVGGGTTAVACQNLKRNFIGIEKEAKYCEIAKQRLRQQTLI